MRTVETPCRSIDSVYVYFGLLWLAILLKIWLPVLTCIHEELQADKEGKINSFNKNSEEIKNIYKP